jgi:sugar lactone lactonase YvrE
MSGLRSAAYSAAAILIALLLYLFLWPVPLEPVAWNAPVDKGLVDPFEPDNRLQKARPIDLGTHEGPEDIAVGPDGYIYTATSDGKILRFTQAGNNVETFAEAGGRPLGMEFDVDGNLFIANSYLGLQRVTPEGIVSTLVDDFNGERITYADDVAVARNGIIYFSDASSKFGASASGGSYEASLLDILEHGGHGRVFRHDPKSDATSIVVDGLNFANGVAVSEDQQYLLINETGSYRVLRYWIEGPDAGTTEVVIDNLPGFPDNINNGLNGRFWIGLVAPRNSIVDRLADKPTLRKMVQRLPSFLRPTAEQSSHVIAIDGDGVVLMNLQDPGAKIPGLTGVCETRDALWLSTLFGNRAGRLDKQFLAN